MWMEIDTNSRKESLNNEQMPTKKFTKIEKLQ